MLKSFHKEREIYMLGELDKVLICIQALDLEGNEIRDWAEVCKLASLPKLQRLLLGGNQISELFYPEQQAGKLNSVFTVQRIRVGGAGFRL